MKVLHIVDERWDSGLTAYGMAAARALRDAGHNVLIGCLPASPALKQAQKEKLRFFLMNRFWEFRRDVRGERFDVINAHTGRGHVWGWGAAWGTDTALVRTRGDARAVRRKFGQGWLYRATDAVIAPSRVIADGLREAYREAWDRVAVVYPGLEIPPYTPEPMGPVRVALVARLDPVKGQEFFLEAVKFLKPRLKDQRFVIAGEEKNTLLASLKGRVEMEGLGPWVEFQGRLPDVNAFMRGCHVGVVASTGSEAVSRVCLEWMAQGRPVVATQVGCLPELVEKEWTGLLVPPSSARSLSEALWRVIDNASWRHSLGKRAFEKAQKQFGAARFGDQTAEVYAKALARRRG